MTSQLLMAANNSGTLSVPSTPEELVGMNESATKAKSPSPGSSSIKMPYQADQQVEFLRLQAEMDALLQQLRLIKQQRETAEATVASH